MLFSVVSPSVVFAFLVNASGALMLVVYLMACFAHLRLRRDLERRAPERLAIKVWLFPWLTYVAVAAMAGVLVAMALTESLASQFYASAACVAVVGVAWFLRRRRAAAVAIAR
jgi:L-asparagine transporter-like permease